MAWIVPAWIWHVAHRATLDSGAKDPPRSLLRLPADPRCASSREQPLRDFAPVQLQQVLVDFIDNRLRDLRVQRLAQAAEEPGCRGDAKPLEAPFRARLGQASGNAPGEQLRFVIELVFGTGA